MERLSAFNLRQINLPAVGVSKTAVLREKLRFSGEHEESSGLTDLELYELVSSIPAIKFSKIPRRFDRRLCRIIWRSFDDRVPLSGKKKFLRWFVNQRVRKSISHTRTLIGCLTWSWPDNAEELIDELSDYTYAHIPWPTRKWQQSMIALAGEGGDLAKKVAETWGGELSCKRGLVKKLWKDLVIHTGKQLSIPSPVNQCLVRSVVSIGFTEKGGFRWPEYAKLYLESLLPPIAQRISSPESEQLKRYTLRFFGRPDRGVWKEVSVQAVSVGYRWMATLRLEKFFDVVEAHQKAKHDETALRHLQERRNFWQKIFDLGVDEVQLALAEKIRSHLNSDDRRLIAPAFISTRGESGITPHHAALIVKIGGLTMVEWSHNRASSIWFRGNPNAPSCSRAQINPGKLLKGEDERLHHRGAWQTKYKNLISNETSLSL